MDACKNKYTLLVKMSVIVFWVYAFPSWAPGITEMPFCKFHFKVPQQTVCLINITAEYLWYKEEMPDVEKRKVGSLGRNIGKRVTSIVCIILSFTNRILCNWASSWRLWPSWSRHWWEWTVFSLLWTIETIPHLHQPVTDLSSASLCCRRTCRLSLKAVLFVLSVLAGLYNSAAMSFFFFPGGAFSTRSVISSFRLRK